jgi:hypothetical protein
MRELTMDAYRVQGEEGRKEGYHNIILQEDKIKEEEDYS